MGFVRKTFGVDLTGGGQRDAIEQGAKRQEAAGREALEALRGDLGPFRQFGAGVLPQLGQSFLSGEAPQSQEFTGFDVSPERVTKNPFFQALLGEQNQNLIGQRAAAGMGSSGGTRDALTRNLLLLGNQFQQQDIGRQAQEFGIQNQLGQQDFSNQLQANQARFNQLFNVAGLGQNAAAQTGAQGASILQNIGNVQAGGLIGASQVQNPLAPQLMGAGLGAVAGGAGLLGKGVTAGAGGLLGLFSDSRLKENIELSHTENGVNWYTWDWNEEGNKVAGDQLSFGVIAQEVMETHPEAVHVGDDGYYRVDYERLQ